MRLYYHKTDGGAEYLSDTFIKCRNGHREGIVNDSTKYSVRIDGDITKDAELFIRENTDDPCQHCSKLGTIICGNDITRHSCFEQ